MCAIDQFWSERQAPLARERGRGSAIGLQLTTIRQFSRDVSIEMFRLTALNERGLK